MDSSYIRINKLFLILIISSFFLLTGCELAGGGWLAQGAPGVLTESSGQRKDKRIRSLTDSSVMSVEGSGWIIEPKRPFTPYTFSASYTEGKSGLFVRAMILNGLSSDSKDGELLVEMVVSNNPGMKQYWFVRDNWNKEAFTIHTKNITYIDGNLPVKATKVENCPQWQQDRHEYIPSDSELINIEAGGYLCFRLVYPVKKPFGKQPILKIDSGINLGTKEISDLKINFGVIPM